CVIWRAASIPFNCGIATSATTTSGEWTSASCTACLPSPASATPSNCSCRSSSARLPLRTSEWSSAKSTLILRMAPSRWRQLQRQRDGEKRAAANVGIDLETASQTAHTLLDAKQAKALPGFRLEAPAVILNDDMDGAGTVLHRDPDCARG